MALVQAYGREDLQQGRFRTENRASLESGIAALRLSKTFKRLSDLLVALGTASVAAYGGLLALAGTLSPGTLVLFMAYLRNVYRPVEKLTEMMLKVSRSQVSAKRLLELADCDMVMRDSPGAIEAQVGRGCIEFKNVNFGYRRDRPVLHDLSFVIRPGERVALVGPSGSGKTTLIGLLLRFYDPQDGSIRLDGLDLRKLTLRSLRDRISVVLQEARLLNQSVYDNIAFGKIGATREEVIRAAHLAQAHGFISRMPDGYDTLISEGGDNLSGGQKQRIHIARALVRDAPIVILDEPTTALDVRAAASVHDALRRLTERKTVLIVAHNFSTLADADRILVLNRGSLDAFGTHDELLSSSPPYRELYELQFGLPLRQAAAPSDG